MDTFVMYAEQTPRRVRRSTSFTRGLALVSGITSLETVLRASPHKCVVLGLPAVCGTISRVNE